MVKPIFIITINNDLTSEEMHNIQASLKKEMPDYYVLLNTSSEVEGIKFECFYEKDFNSIRFEELKEIVKGKI